MESADKINQVKRLIDASFHSLQQARALLEIDGGDEGITGDILSKKAENTGSIQHTSEGMRIIEGVFDGQNMIGPDGKQYSVPANYASKSKLVEGDLMKLTIDRTGSFIYKQIGPVERDRKSGVLTQDPDTDEYRVLVSGRMYRTLLASITYFKGEPGDEVIVLLPKGKESQWAAVENIIKELGSGTSSSLGASPASRGLSQLGGPAETHEETSPVDESVKQPLPAAPSDVPPGVSEDEFEKI